GRHRVLGLPAEQASVEGRRGVRAGLAGVCPAGNTGQVTVSLWHRVLLPVAHRWRPYSSICQTAASAQSVLARRLLPRRTAVPAGSARCAVIPARRSSSTT